MAFTEEEKMKWHDDRRAGRGETGSESGVPMETCGHCGNPFRPSDGTVTADFALCDVCND
jgi:hypothetical protein